MFASALLRAVDTEVKGLWVLRIGEVTGTQPSGYSRNNTNKQVISHSRGEKFVFKYCMCIWVGYVEAIRNMRDHLYVPFV